MPRMGGPKARKPSGASKSGQDSKGSIVELLKETIADLSAAAAGFWSGPAITPAKVEEAMRTTDGMDPQAGQTALSDATQASAKKVKGRGVLSIVFGLIVSFASGLIADEVRSRVWDWITKDEEAEQLKADQEQCSQGCTQAEDTANAAANELVAATAAHIRAITSALSTIEPAEHPDAFASIVAAGDAAIAQCSAALIGLSQDRDRCIASTYNEMLARIGQVCETPIPALPAACDEVKKCEAVPAAKEAKPGEELECVEKQVASSGPASAPVECPQTQPAATAAPAPAPAPALQDCPKPAPQTQPAQAPVGIPATQEVQNRPAPVDCPEPQPEAQREPKAETRPEPVAQVRIVNPIVECPEEASPVPPAKQEVSCPPTQPAATGEIKVVEQPAPAEPCNCDDEKPDSVDQPSGETEEVCTEETSTETCGLGTVLVAGLALVAIGALIDFALDHFLSEATPEPAAEPVPTPEPAPAAVPEPQPAAHQPPPPPITDPAQEPPPPPKKVVPPPVTTEPPSPPKQFDSASVVGGTPAPAEVFPAAGEAVPAEPELVGAGSSMGSSAHIHKAGAW
ncbi:hypothetical protein [Corynebacterium epidermidicanis]|uniref:Uncharacterized protein n=1 Tax=Corynebacterium epidermidicanis TaxID=1050174 RepID=A0A0G3GP62_9CORY|nr:hypothetical protein [Corynebacterium epidermidicanis]AKK02350.1 hypothetical protein CEPID_02345 [Corynebacterium epidermidicanis]